MPNQNPAAHLRQTVVQLQTMTRFALAVLALASGVYTYLGVRSILDGSANFVFFAAIIYSAAVSVGIYAFWSYMLRFVPLVRDGLQRVWLFFVIAIGSLMIIAMSSWLNAAALAGSAALEQHMAVTLEGYVADLDKAHANAIAAQSLLPDVARAEERFQRLAADERQSGALTGTSGSGSVVQLLTQMGAQMQELKRSITDNGDKAASLFEAGTAHITTMRDLVSGAGTVQPRADQFSAEAVALAGVISSLQENSVAPSVKRAAADLSLGFIAPVADGGNADLVVRQDQVMETVRTSVAAQSQALSAAADEILDVPRVEARRFVPLSSAEAVLRYWEDFIPSWAGAISIDLLPLVMVLVLMVVHDAIRRESEDLSEAETITAAEMIRAVDLFRRMGPDMMASEQREPLVEPLVAARADQAMASETSPAEVVGAETKVTPIDQGMRKRGDGPGRA